MRRLADILHKTAVTGLIGLTALGAITLGLQTFTYFTKGPARKPIPAKSLETDLTDS